MKAQAAALESKLGEEKRRHVAAEERAGVLQAEVLGLQGELGEVRVRGWDGSSEDGEGRASSNGQRLA